MACKTHPKLHPFFGIAYEKIRADHEYRCILCQASRKDLCAKDKRRIARKIAFCFMQIGPQGPPTQRQKLAEFQFYTGDFESVPRDVMNLIVQGIDDLRGILSLAQTEKAMEETIFVKYLENTKIHAFDIMLEKTFPRIFTPEKTLRKAIEAGEHQWNVAFNYSVEANALTKFMLFMGRLNADYNKHSRLYMHAKGRLLFTSQVYKRVGDTEPENVSVLWISIKPTPESVFGPEMPAFLRSGWAKMSPVNDYIDGFRIALLSHNKDAVDFMEDEYNIAGTKWQRYANDIFAAFALDPDYYANLLNTRILNETKRDVQKNIAGYDMKSIARAYLSTGRDELLQFLDWYQKSEYKYGKERMANQYYEIRLELKESFPEQKDRLEKLDEKVVLFVPREK